MKLAGMAMMSGYLQVFQRSDDERVSDVFLAKFAAGCNSLKPLDCRSYISVSDRVRGCGPKQLRAK